MGRGLVLVRAEQGDGCVPPQPLTRSPFSPWSPLAPCCPSNPRSPWGEEGAGSGGPRGAAPGPSPRSQPVPKVPAHPRGPNTSPRSQRGPTLGPMSPSFPGTPGTPDSPSSPCGTKQTSVSPRRASRPIPHCHHSPAPLSSPAVPSAPAAPALPTAGRRSREGVRPHLWGHPQQGTLTGVGVRAQPSLVAAGRTEGPHSVGTRSPSPPCLHRGRRRL